MVDSKIFGQSEQLPDAKCPYCFTICNAALPLQENGERQTPQVYSLLVCSNCAKISRFANNLMLVRISDNQLQTILRANPTIARQAMDLQLAAERIINKTSFRRFKGMVL